MRRRPGPARSPELRRQQSWLTSLPTFMLLPGSASAGPAAGWVCEGPRPRPPEPGTYRRAAQTYPSLRLSFLNQKHCSAGSLKTDYRVPCASFTHPILPKMTNITNTTQPESYCPAAIVNFVPTSQPTMIKSQGYWFESSRGSLEMLRARETSASSVPPGPARPQLLLRFVAAPYERRSLGIASHWRLRPPGGLTPIGRCGSRAAWRAETGAAAARPGRGRGAARPARRPRAVAPPRGSGLRRP